MKHIWSILCKKSIIDSDTNNISIFDILEEGTIAFQLKEGLKKTGEPIAIPLEFELVSLWVSDEKKSEKEIKILIEVYDPNKKKIGSFKRNIPMPENKQRMRTIIKFMSFKFTRAGNYSFQVRSEHDKKYKLVAEIPLVIKLKVPPKK